jgi:hypothetical protein
VIGAALALRLKTVNRFLIGSMPVLLVMALPAVDLVAGRYLPPWFGLLARFSPADGALSLARAAYSTVPGAELAAGTAAAALWTALASRFLLGPAVAAVRGE